MTGGLELPDQLQPAALQIHVLPAQPKQLTLTHPGTDGQHIQCFQPVTRTASRKLRTSASHSSRAAGMVVGCQLISESGEEALYVLACEPAEGRLEFLG